MADNVYCVPELEGESLDSNFSRHLKGLSLKEASDIIQNKKGGNK